MSKELAASGQLSADRKVKDWWEAAMRLGEQLGSNGPRGYYELTPTEWLKWAESELALSSLRGTFADGIEAAAKVFLQYHAVTQDQADFANAILRGVRALAQSQRGTTDSEKSVQAPNVGQPQEDRVSVPHHQRLEAERIAGSRSNSGTQSSDHPTEQSADELLRECKRVLAMSKGWQREFDPSVMVTFLDRIDAHLSRKEPINAAKHRYETDNPLGGPARMFEAIAERIRSGEDYYSVLADYGVTVEAK